ncbi:hypothetical protein DHEL01_v208985 [Diaporthe helianthi]|uniref:BTB domain-containing protein n=1 Tax=Diaporthe helianthi TaxID=158607 RepID=A0A2P5HQW9_DIAHE|nr:hypothetical protein DHEL01_v208985 [Diaporthe helianthi]
MEKHALESESQRSGASGGPSEGAVVDRRLEQLRGCIQSLRAGLVPGSEPGSVDSAYDEFARVMHEASDAVEAVLAAYNNNNNNNNNDNSSRPTTRCRRAGNGSVAETVERLESMRIAQGGRATDDDIDSLKASFSALGLGDSSPLAVIQDWRAVLMKLLQSHRSSLAATMQAYDRGMRPEATARALDDAGYRAAISVVSPAHWPLYERRLRHYETVKETVMHVDRLLMMAAKVAKVGVREYVISPRGNAVLEFENKGAPPDTRDTQVLRFRVSSHMLAETSPIFEAVFGGQFSHPRILDRDLRELDGQVPREPPRSIGCADGSCVRLYSTPQLEPNKHEALTILLYAAHMQNDKVPREVSFAQFTAIADVCLRYKCTSPLELMVEHRWLPAWVHKATEQQPDGMLLISYAFGLRRLFTRMSKTAVLNLVDEQELRAKSWPKAIKDKIWAVRSAKVAQVHSTCVGAVHEYFRPPARASSHAPRCPRGDHWCDATSLGWLLLVLNELQLAWTVVNPSALPHAQGQQQGQQQSQPPRSLAQLLDVLRSVPSPRHPRHPPHLGSNVCDPAPAFRAAVNDVYNSISGLSLFDVDGKRRGWGLSKHRQDEPQSMQNVPLGRLSRLSLSGLDMQQQQEVVATAQAPAQQARGLMQLDSQDLMPGHGSDTDTTTTPDDLQSQQSPLAFTPDEALYLRIMRHAETFDDLHALALVSPVAYAAFKNNELALTRPLVGVWRRQTLIALAGGPSHPGHLLPLELARLGDLQPRSEESKSPGHAPGPSPPLPFLLNRHHSVEDDALAEAAQLESSCQTDAEDAYEAAACDGCEGEESREMTEDEAGLILWPEQPAPSSFRVGPGDPAKGKMAAPPARGAVDREDRHDKFLAQDLCLLPEHKSLAVLGDKSLGVDLDRRKGINSA